MQRNLQNRILLAVTLASLVAVGGCDKLRARDKLNKGVQAFRGGQFDLAIEDFKQAMNRNRLETEGPDSRRLFP